MRFSFLLMLLALSSFAVQFRDRWVYFSGNVTKPDGLAHAKEVIAVAKEKQLNGILISCGLETCWKWSGEEKALFLDFKRTCDAAGVDIVPIIWSIGYGTMLGEDRSLAAGVPVKDSEYVVKGDTAYFSQETSPRLKNGDFENPQGNNFPGFNWMDNPGSVAIPDTQNVAPDGGKCCLRLETAKTDKHGHARTMRTLKLKPYQQYQISCSFKCKDLKKSNAFRIEAYTPKGVTIMGRTFQVEPNSDWKTYSILMNTGEHSECNLYVGLWEAHEGTAWIDNLQVQNVGILNQLRRPGTPLTVRSAATGTVYQEGKDYAPIPALAKFSQDAANTVTKITLLPGTRIQDKEKLLVSYYHSVTLMGFQIPVCMSEPKLYQLFQESAKAIQALCAPKKWFLSMDEIRVGGTCQACEQRHTDMAHILADCIQRQRQIIRNVNPEAEIYIWSDMLDPNHNAVDHYYCTKGTYVGVWDLIPKDLIISCWYHGKREASMAFFSQHGFHTQGAAYYDRDTLDTCRDWLATCKKTPGCLGIMYTTWRNKYQLLPAFGDMLLQEAANK